MKIFYKGNYLEKNEINLVKSFILGKLKSFDSCNSYNIYISNNINFPHEIDTKYIDSNVLYKNNNVHVLFDLIFLVYHEINFIIRDDLEFDAHGRIRFDRLLKSKSFPYLDHIFRKIDQSLNKMSMNKNIKFSVDVDHIKYQNFSFLRFIHEFKRFYRYNYNYNYFHDYLKSNTNYKFYLILKMAEILHQYSISADFFFMFCFNRTDYDSGYILKENQNFIYKYLQDMGHRVGFHPSYYTYSSTDVWEQEYSKYIKVIGNQDSIVRTHYLRTNYNFYYDLLEKYNVDEDHSIGSSQGTGFYCGISSGFSPINNRNNSFYNFKSYPLNFMDDFLFDNDSKFEDLYLALKTPYDISLLFHNTSFFFTKEFLKILSELKK